jgi:hypothetical protein
MEVCGADRLRKGFAQAVQKIEDQRFFDLDFFLRALELANANALAPPGNEPARGARD